MEGRLELNLKYKEDSERLLENSNKLIKEFFWYKVGFSEYSSVRTYIYALNAFANWVGSGDMVNADLVNVKSSEISYYMETEVKYNKHKKEQTGEIRLNSYSTRNLHYVALYGFYDFLLENGYVKSNPVSKKLRLKKKDDVKRIYLGEEDLKKIISKMNDFENQKTFSRDRLMMTLFIVTGMRASALASINIDDFDLDSKTLKVKDKGSKVHEYHLPDLIIDNLKAYLVDREKMLDGKELDALFVSTRLERLAYDSIKHLVRKYSGYALGYKISPHKLRSAFCTINYEKTGDIEYVRDAVGHSRVDTTMAYIRKKALIS